MNDPSADDDRGLATERTALAWRRTGMAHVVTAALLLRLLEDSGVRWPAAGLLLVSSGVAASHRIPPRARMAVVTAATSAVSVLAALGGLTA